LGVSDAGDHVGVDAGRIDAVHGYAARREHWAQRLGERVGGGLGS
jgi:hypothetical protein